MNQLELIARALQSSKLNVFFSGAGMSTASGIPDFRSPGGIWSKYQPVYFDEFMGSESARHEYWRQKAEAHRDFAGAKPNDGHRTVAKWEARGILRGVITQNIDELHQQAGSQNVLELHGTARRVACMDCDYIVEADPLVRQFLETDRVPACPRCSDGGRLKHATVSFGQSLPSDTLYEAGKWCREAGAFFAVGSSLVVTPAADFPRIAKQHGATFVIINRDPTPLDSIADYVIRDDIVKVLAEIDANLAE
ncbi:MAG: NAD-dependent protein deacylase [Planctomycetales bacterium]|nr:NAD-dependent protein deacylase [Planctomycetales bacterium]